MPKPRSKEPIERIILKLPKSLAEYLRSTFRHGERSAFLAECIKAHQHTQEVKHIEEKLRHVGK